MQSAIASGEMPQYCVHCGSIETPTWRKLYFQECEGKPSPLDYAEGEGETIAIEITDTDAETGEATRYVIRKSMKKTKDTQPGKGFEAVVVCNPCGLWFNKTKEMRPADRWGRKTGTRNRKKPRTAEDGSAIPTDGLEPQSEAFFGDDQIMPDDGPDDGDAGGDEADGLPERRPTHALPPKRRRANSMQPQRTRRRSGDTGLNASQLDAALVRAVQSSPLRPQGSQQSPIEIEDLTPKPLRRLLFPSPSPLKIGSVKALDDNGQASLNATPPSLKHSAQKLPIGATNHDINVFEAFTFDKENMPPDVDVDDELMHLFEGSPSAAFKTPHKTPLPHGFTPKSQRQLGHLLKTPTPASRKRKILTPDQNSLNAALPNDFMTSPPRYFLRSTPSRQNRTPGRVSSQSRVPVSPSPFTRHLTAMLSDNNESGVFTSPSRGSGFGYSDIPTFTTPGRQVDWRGLEEILSSDFAVAYEGEGEGEGR